MADHLARTFEASAKLAATLFPEINVDAYFPETTKQATDVNEQSTRIRAAATQKQDGSPLDAGDALLVQSPRRRRRSKSSRQQEQQFGRKLLTRHADPMLITASLATLCGPKDKRLFVTMWENSLQCFKTPSMKQSLNLIVPLAKHAFAAVLLGCCNPSRREITLCLSTNAKATRAVAQLKAAVSANFPLVLRFSTEREFQRWFAELVKRLCVDFSIQPPRFRSSGIARLQKKQSVSAALSKLVFWYYCEGGNRSNVRVCAHAGGVRACVDVLGALCVRILSMGIVSTEDFACRFVGIVVCRRVAPVVL